jgi:uncharacterized membrane protein YhhN
MVHGWMDKHGSMKEKHWIFLFFIVLAGHIAGIQWHINLLEKLCKPLIITALIGYFNFRMNHIVKGYAKWILAALLFSLAGDILLMFQERNSLFFLLGLSAFLLAHIFYILFFHQVRTAEQIKINIYLPGIVAAYYAILIYILLPHLQEMKVPVLVYGIVISIMFLLAMHMLFIKNTGAGKWMMAGALLFVISDSVLAINKFYQPFEAAVLIIMVTYGTAQFLIVKGAADYMAPDDKI